MGISRSFWMRKPRTRNEGTMTEAAFFGTIRSALRELSFRGKLGKPRQEATRRARISRGMYRCSECGEATPHKDIEVDHIHPCGPLQTFHDLEGFCRRLFCDADGLRVVCKRCHHNKTFNRACGENS